MEGDDEIPACRGGDPQAFSNLWRHNDSRAFESRPHHCHWSASSLVRFPHRTGGGTQDKAQQRVGGGSPQHDTTNKSFRLSRTLIYGDARSTPVQYAAYKWDADVGPLEG